MNKKTLTYEIKEGIGFITLSSPPKNEIGLLFFNEFYKLISEIEKDNNIKALIIKSEGRHFSSGTDISQLLSLFKEYEYEIPKTIKQNNTAFRKLSGFAFPVVACLKGICYGAAFELALSAHFRIASKNTLISLPETSFNLIPGLAGIFHSKQCMGKAETMQFVLSGNSLSAEEAFKHKLIDIVTEKDNLCETAISLVKNLKKEYKKEYKNLYLKKLRNSVI